jgi:hypothetical protein
VLVTLEVATALAAAPPPVTVTMDGERFDIAAEGNTVTGRRQAPVPYVSLSVLAAAVAQERPLPAAVRLVRGVPHQIVDYVLGVTDDGLLILGEQVRTLQPGSSRYILTEGSIRRAYPALEATAPWTWIVDIPLGREVTLTLEIRAMAASWPVRGVAITPRLTP